MFPKGVQHMILNKMTYTAKDPSPPTALSVPKRNKKLEVGRKRKRKRRRRKCPSVDPRYRKGMGKKCSGQKIIE